VAAVLDIHFNELLVERVEGHKMGFLKIIHRIRRGEIERAEVHLLLPIFGDVEERKALGSANDGAGMVDSAAVIDQNRAGNRFPALFPPAHFRCLKAYPLARIRWEFVKCRADGLSLCFEDSEVVPATRAASRPADQMARVTRGKPLAHLVHFVQQCLVEGHKQTARQRMGDIFDPR